jgi:hypothetical protein
MAELSGPSLEEKQLRRRVTLTAVVLASLLGSLLSASAAQGASSQPKKAPPYVFGINTYLTYNCQTIAQVDRYATTEINEYKKLRANAIAIAFPLYTASLTSNSVTAMESCTSNTEQTPPAAIVGDVVKIAHKAGLSVLLRPLIDQANLFSQSPGAWRGNLAPSDVSEWFTNYLTTLRPYLQIAQTDHVEHFAIQSELDSLADLPNWTTAIQLSRGIYSGNIVFDYSWDTPTVKVSRPGTTLAIDTYPKVNSPVTATPAQILSQWNHLLTTRTYYRVPSISKVTIDEIGIAAQDGAYQQSYKGQLTPTSTYPFNQTIQVNWFTAACTFMKEHHLKGIYYWGPWLAASYGAMLSKPDANKPSDIQPQAGSAIRRCFN